MSGATPAEENNVQPAELAEKDAVCVHCRSAISPGAPRCATCGGYQNWRRHLALSSTVLSLLVALVSVTALAVPVVLDAVRGHRSVLSVDLSFVDGEVAYFHFANQGGAPGLVESVTLAARGYNVDFEIDQLGQEADERLIRANEGGVLRLDIRRVRSNGLRIHMPSDEAEAYMDELTRWGGWMMHEENAFQALGGQRAAAADDAKRLVNREAGGDHDGPVDLSTAIRWALQRAQSRFERIEPRSVRSINVDDWYQPKSYDDIASILEEHGPALARYLNAEAVELYVEVNGALAFLDAVLSRGELAFVVRLRNSDGSRLEQRIPVAYGNLRRFLRPAVLDAPTADPEWLAFFE